MSRNFNILTDYTKVNNQDKRRSGLAAPWLAAALIVGLAAPSIAHADFAAGDHAARTGDFATALTEWRQGAKVGDARSQYGLSWLYAEGKGVPRNHALAADWCRRAAEQGLAKAQYNLGLMYSRGHGVEQSAEMAAEWYIKAARQGDSDAQNNLGSAYAEGLGVEQNLVEAFVWFSLAERQRNPVARGNLMRLKPRMDQKQIDEARRKLGKWL